MNTPAQNTDKTLECVDCLDYFKKEDLTCADSGQKVTECSLEDEHECVEVYCDDCFDDDYVEDEDEEDEYDDGCYPPVTDE